MAKDTRKKKGEVSLAATAGVTKKKKKKKKKASVGTVIIRVLVAVLVTLSLAFIAVVVYGVVSSFSSGGEKHEVQLYSYDTTPQAQEQKVSYFLVGLSGKDDSTTMDMLTLICHDKKAKNVRLLQVPTDTYIGKNGDFTVTRVGNVWNNPTPLTWCETCRGRVYEPEQKDGKHTVCNTKLTEKTGSAVESLVSVFNDQFSMPIDNYFILSHDTLVELVDLVGGIDVELEASVKVGAVTYPAGKQVLDGAAALYYSTEYNYNNTPGKDLDRLIRQRKVWTALLQRLSVMDENELLKDVIKPVMAGANPLRTNTDAKSVAKMMAGIHSGSTENMTFTEALTKLIKNFRKVDLKNATFYLLPGNVSKMGSTTYFGINKADAVKLLQDKFNPYGLEMKEEHLQINEIAAGSEKTDIKEQTMQQLAVEQSVPTTTVTTATTTATTVAQ